MLWKLVATRTEQKAQKREMQVLRRISGKIRNDTNAIINENIRQEYKCHI